MNKLQTSTEEKYEFKKTAKHDVPESRFEDVWDVTGRYLAIYGVKRSPIDKTDKSIRFYTIFGELVGAYEKLSNLAQFKWRPRPQGILKPKDIQKLSKEYKNKYLKLFKDEEKKEKKVETSAVKESKKKIRDEFLSEFFMPLRKEFEDNIPKYEKLWPIKEKDMLPEPVEIEIIYSYENVISERKIQ